LADHLGMAKSRARPAVLELSRHERAWPGSWADGWFLDRLGAVAGRTRRARVQRVGEAGADSQAVTVIRVAEAEIGADLSRRLQSLLQACFPGYPSRSYFKLPPHFRYLAMTSSGDVAAQMGVEFRVVRVGDAVLRTFGVVDLCVMKSQRSRGLAGTLLAEVTELARSCGMAFIVLFADDDRLYARNGWARVMNRCSWVQINDHVTLGLARQADPGAMMVKALGSNPGPRVMSTCWAICSDVGGSPHHRAVGIAAHR